MAPNGPAARDSPSSSSSSFWAVLSSSLAVVCAASAGTSPESESAEFPSCFDRAESTLRLKRRCVEKPLGLLLEWRRIRIDGGREAIPTGTPEVGGGRKSYRPGSWVPAAPYPASRNRSDSSSLLA